MFGISGEHLLVLLVVLLFFGPRRLPELGNSLGRTMKNFKDALNGADQVKPNELPRHEAKTAPQPEAQAETVNVGEKKV